MKVILTAKTMAVQVEHHLAHSKARPMDPHLDDFKAQLADGTRLGSLEDSTDGFLLW